MAFLEKRINQGEGVLSITCMQRLWFIW